MHRNAITLAVTTYPLCFMVHSTDEALPNFGGARVRPYAGAMRTGQQCNQSSGNFSCSQILFGKFIYKLLCSCLVACTILFQLSYSSLPRDFLCMHCTVYVRYKIRGEEERCERELRSIVQFLLRFQNMQLVQFILLASSISL